MYFNVFFFKLKSAFVVSELYIYQNARCNNKQILKILLLYKFRNTEIKFEVFSY